MITWNEFCNQAKSMTILGEAVNLLNQVEPSELRTAYNGNPQVSLTLSQLLEDAVKNQQFSNVKEVLEKLQQIDPNATHLSNLSTQDFLNWFKEDPSIYNNATVQSNFSTMLPPTSAEYAQALAQIDASKLDKVPVELYDALDPSDEALLRTQRSDVDTAITNARKQWVDKNSSAFGPNSQMPSNPEYLDLAKQSEKARNFLLTNAAFMQQLDPATNPSDAQFLKDVARTVNGKQLNNVQSMLANNQTALDSFNQAVVDSVTDLKGHAFDYAMQNNLIDASNIGQIATQTGKSAKDFQSAVDTITDQKVKTSLQASIEGSKAVTLAQNFKYGDNPFLDQDFESGKLSAQDRASYLNNESSGRFYDTTKGTFTDAGDTLTPAEKVQIATNAGNTKLAQQIQHPISSGLSDIWNNPGDVDAYKRVWEGIKSSKANQPLPNWRIFPEGGNFAKTTGTGLGLAALGSQIQNMRNQNPDSASDYAKNAFIDYTSGPAGVLMTAAPLAAARGGIGAYQEAMKQGAGLLGRTAAGGVGAGLGALKGTIAPGRGAGLAAIIGAGANAAMDAAGVEDNGVSYLRNMTNAGLNTYGLTYGSVLGSPLTSTVAGAILLGGELARTHGANNIIDAMGGMDKQSKAGNNIARNSNYKDYFFYDQGNRKLLSWQDLDKNLTDEQIDQKYTMYSPHQQKLIANNGQVEAIQKALSSNGNNWEMNPGFWTNAKATWESLKAFLGADDKYSSMSKQQKMETVANRLTAQNNAMLANTSYGMKDANGNKPMTADLLAMLNSATPETREGLRAMFTRQRTDGGTSLNNAEFDQLLNLANELEPFIQARMKASGDNRYTFNNMMGGLEDYQNQPGQGL